jgi:hypothetical protein
LSPYQVMFVRKCAPAREVPSFHEVESSVVDQEKDVHPVLLEVDRRKKEAQALDDQVSKRQEVGVRRQVKYWTTKRKPNVFKGKYTDMNHLLSIYSYLLFIIFIYYIYLFIIIYYYLLFIIYYIYLLYLFIIFTYYIY